MRMLPTISLPTLSTQNKIRLGKKADWKNFSTLQQEAFPRDTPNKKFFNNKIHNKQLLIIGKYEGHIAYEHYTESPFGNSVYIQEFAVKKEHRRQGLGRQLIQKIIKIAQQKKVPYIYLSTTVDNKEAQEFYKKTGFMKNGSFTYLKDGDNVYFYSKKV
jgi:ribosomal protein S18 acetylase RimI-like enzyme